LISSIIWRRQDLLGGETLLYDYLNEFSTVAQEGSLSAAAAKLNISQPSLGRHLSALETELGVKLFTRGSFGVRLTDKGRAVLVTAFDIAALEQSVADHFSDKHRRIQERHILVGMLAECRKVSRMLSEGCSQLNAEGYRIGIRFLQPNTLNSVMTSLKQRDIDIVIGLRGNAELARNAVGFSVVHLTDVPTAIILDPKHPLAQTGVFTVSDLTKLRFKRNPGWQESQTVAWSEFCRCCEEKGVSPLSHMAYQANRYGLEVRSPNDASYALLGSAEVDRYCAAGYVAIPVSDLQLGVYAIMRFEDETANRLAEYALAVDDTDEDSPRATSHQEAYGRAAKNNMELASPSFKKQGELYEQIINEPEVADDLVLPDGTVVDKSYVALRNRLNRIGDGLSNSPVATSYEAIMALWSVEEAQAELEMPSMKWFTAYDFAASSGRGVDECIEILDRLSRRNLIYRVLRGGTYHFCLLGWVYGIWEFSVQRYDREFLGYGIYGSDAGTGSQYPIVHVCPVSRDVIKDGKMVPYRDWEAYVKRQTKACLSPCQCRRAHDIVDTRICEDKDHPTEVCLTFGEMAEYWLENGNGEEIGVDESLEIARDAIFNHALVPQLNFGKNPEVLCLCHGDCCNVLAAIKAIEGTPWLKRNMSAYTLEYNRDICIGCGTCLKRCPMSAVSFDSDGCRLNADACIGCGQCALKCPSGARLLVAKAAEDICELPDDWPEGYRWRAVDRMTRGHIADFTGTRLNT
jgi:DNA-binding transcriptional LysR family regulator/ferredoxin